MKTPLERGFLFRHVNCSSVWTMPSSSAWHGNFCMHKETRMEKRILAVLIATLAGGAYAQTTVTSGASGTVVTNGYGQCWQSGASGTGTPVPCPPTGATAAGQSAAPAAAAPAAAAPAATRTQLAQNTQAPRRTAAEPAGVTASAGSPPPAPAYVGSGAGVVATNPFGLCWRSGAEWSPEKAAAPCDAVPVATIPPAPVAAAPQPEPAPAPLAAAPAPAPVVIEKISLNTDVLFEFNKAELRPSGQQRLDELAKSAQGANVEKIVLTGHADRIGSEEYNKELSEKRAQAVADYLASKGVDKSRLQVEARGESQPITGAECSKLGAESNKNQKLIACLQPDRRVDAELLGSREQTAGTPAPAAAGATGASSSSSSSGSGSSSSTSESGTNK
jgi:OOP family OmpA-OmpF porin